MPPAERAAGSSRPMPRLLLLAAAVLLLARVATGVWEQRRAPQVAERIAWVEIRNAEIESRRTHKPILYEFGAEWCGPCKTLSKEVFSDDAAAARIEQTFVPVRVLDRQQEDGRNPPEVERLQQAYKIAAFPTLVATWPGSQHFEMTDGYPGRAATEQWLARAAVTLSTQPPGAAVDSVLPLR